MLMIKIDSWNVKILIFCIARLSGLSILLRNAESVLSSSNYYIALLNNVSFKHLEYA